MSAVLGPKRKWSKTELYAHRKNKAEDKYLQQKLVELKREFHGVSSKTIDEIREVNGWFKPIRQHTGHSPWALPPASANGRRRMNRPLSSESIDSTRSLPSCTVDVNRKSFPPNKGNDSRKIISKIPSTSVKVKYNTFVRKPKSGNTNKTSEPNPSQHSPSSAKQSAASKPRTPFFITETKKSSAKESTGGTLNAAGKKIDNRSSLDLSLTTGKKCSMPKLTNIKVTAAENKSKISDQSSTNGQDNDTLCGEDIVGNNSFERGYSMITNMPAVYEIEERKQKRLSVSMKQADIVKYALSDRSDSPDIIPENELNVFCDSDEEVGDDDAEHTVPQLNMAKVEKMEKKLEKIEERNKRLFKRSSGVIATFVKLASKSSKTQDEKVSGLGQESVKHQAVASLPAVEFLGNTLQHKESNFVVSDKYETSSDEHRFAVNNSIQNTLDISSKNLQPPRQNEENPLVSQSHKLKTGFSLLNRKFGDSKTEKYGNWTGIQPPPAPPAPIIPNMEKVSQRAQQRQENIRRRYMYDNPIGLRGKRDDQKVVISKADVRKMASELIKQHDNDKALRKRKSQTEPSEKLTLSDRIKMFMTVIDQYCMSSQLDL